MEKAAEALSKAFDGLTDECQVLSDSRQCELREGMGCCTPRAWSSNFEVQEEEEEVSSNNHLPGPSVALWILGARYRNQIVAGEHS